MKKILFCLCAAALCLSLSACGGKKAAPFDPERDAKTLQDASGVFGEALTEIDQATACALYGIDESTVTASAVYGSTTSAEELAIFTFSDETAAQTAGELLGYRVEDRKDELKTYLPDELPKLDKAVVQVRSNSALLVIAADYGPVDAFLDG
jgi:hypothetical protein